LSEIVLTAYDIQRYLREGLPAMRAAIYRGDLSQAKDVLILHDETIYGEYDLSQALVEDDYSWAFTEEAEDPESLDPDGTLIGLTYPLILAYHHPELFHARLGGAELHNTYPFSEIGVNGLTVQPGFREGLRTMWEIVGFLSPEATVMLQQYCKNALEKLSNGGQKTPDGTAHLLTLLSHGLTSVIQHGYGLVIERD
jgi:hypothetical protein